MLPVRLGVVTAMAALCLWGLFSLLDSLKEPGLLRSSKAVVIKGCDSMQSDTARERCPELLCQKALLDTKQVALSTRFEVDVNRPETVEERLIAGRGTGPGTTPLHFKCVIAAAAVSEAKLIDADELRALAASSGDED